MSRWKNMKTKIERECPECYDGLSQEEACSPYSPEVSEEVWVCKNKECCNYDKIVYDDFDFNEIARDVEEENRRENEMIYKMETEKARNENGN